MKVLKLIEPLYHFLSGARNIFYDLDLVAPQKLAMPVISVGNISFGGVGKTPCIMMLAAEFARTHKISIVCKSYKGSLKNPEKVDLNQPSAWAKFGDEACLLKLRLPGCEVWSGPDKTRTAIAAAAASPGLILVDDGFSHRKLFRNFDLLLIDATQGFETYLRESVSNVKRADAILITKVNMVRPESVERMIATILKVAPQLKNKIYSSSVRTSLSVDVSDSLFVFCGLGRPETLVEDLKKQGYKISKLETFPDHHMYSEIDQKKIFAKYADFKNENRNLKLITTEKDFVKISNPDLLKNAVVTRHDLVIDSAFKGVLVGKIRESF